MADHALAIDTDIGDNVDDSLALALACLDRRANLASVSTVHGDTVLRAELARAILTSTSHGDVPVIPGSEHPLIAPVERARPLLYDSHPRVPLPKSQLEREPFAIWSRLAERFGRLRLLTIGPLTNVALAIRLRRTLLESLEITAMLGAVHLDAAETNVRLDPEAARVVLDSGVPITIVPLDVTLECPLPAWVPEALRQSHQPLLRALGNVCLRWQELTGREAVIPHDPLALFSVLEPDAFRYQPMQVEVELCGNRRGYLNCQPRETGHVLVATHVDMNRFLTWFMETLGVSDRQA